jgi:hypothetical protein
MSEGHRRLYLLSYRAIDGTLKRAWFGSKEEALAAANRLNVDYEISEALI